MSASRELTQAASGASLPAHTPGPWVIEPGPECLWIGTGKAAGPSPLTGVHKVGRITASVDGGWESGYRESYLAEQLANARLIAAAPDLLKSLREFMEDERFQVGVGGNPIAVEAMIIRARVAIAKALGTSTADTTEPAATPGRNP